MKPRDKKHTDSTELDGVVVESLDAAAELTGYTREQIQQWKRLGWSAFKPGNRIDLGELVNNIADNPDVRRENSPLITLAQIEVREALLRAANNEAKLSERRKVFAKGEDVRRSVARAFLAMKIKLLGCSSKLSQPFSLMNDPREIQAQLDAEHCAALGAIERNEWFDKSEVAKWLATQPEILKEANKLAKA